MGENNLTDLIPENGVNLGLLSKISEYKIPLLGTSGFGENLRKWYPIGSIVSSNQKHLILASPHTASRKEKRKITNEKIYKIIQQALPMLFEYPEQILDRGLKIRDAETCAECVISLKNNLTRREKQNGNILQEFRNYQLPQIRIRTVSIFNENHFQVDITLNEDKACQEYYDTYNRALMLNEFEKETGSIRAKGDKKRPSKFVRLNFENDGTPKSFQAWLALHDSEYPDIEHEVNNVSQNKINQERDAAWREIEQQRRSTTYKDKDTDTDEEDDTPDSDGDIFSIIPQDIARRKRRTKKRREIKTENISYLNKQDLLYIINEATKRIISKLY